MQHKLPIMNENEIKDINPNAEEIKNLEAQIAGIDITSLDPRDNGKIKQDSPVVEQTQQQVKETVEITETSTEDPITAELERVKGQTQGKTPQEKFEYKLKNELARAKAMGIDIESLTGVKTEQKEEYSDDEKPLTRKDLEAALQNIKSPSKSAQDMAMEIPNEAERELHLYYLDNVIKSSGNPEQDFQIAKNMVTGIKLQNQAKMNNVKPQAQTFSTANSVQPAKNTNFDSVKLTPEEDMLFRDASVRGITITKEEIIAMRSR